MGVRAVVMSAVAVGVLAVATAGWQSADAAEPAVVGLELTAQAGARAELALSLADGAAAPLPGTKLAILVDGRRAGSARTGADGRATARLRLRVGEHTVVARFVGSSEAAAADSPALPVSIARPAALAPSNRAALDTIRPRLSWTEVPGAVGYVVRILPARGAAIELASAATSATAPKLPRGAAFRWTVAAELARGTSLPSKPRAFSVRRDAGSGWVFEVVRSAGSTGAYPRIAVDSAGRPRIVSLDAESNSFLLSLRDGAAWTDEVVAPARGRYVLGKRSALAIDGDDRVHVCWTVPDDAVRYARRDPDGLWTPATPIAGGIPYAFLGGYCAVVVDASGTPQVLGRVYGLTAVADTTLGWWTPGAPAFRALDGSPSQEAGRFVTAAIGSDGATRAAWQLTDTALAEGSHLRFARSGDPAWSVATVASDLIETTSSGNEWEGLASLALDAADRPRIAFLSTSGNYEFAAFDGNAWELSTIAPVSTGRERAHVSSAVGPGGVDHVVLLGVGARLVYARRDGGKWTVDDSVDSVGEMCSLAVDADGGVHVAYHDDLEADLRYAYLAP